MQSQIFFYSMIFQQLIHSLQLNLRKLILLLAIFSVISLFIISLLVSYYIQKNQLINNSLSVNMISGELRRSADIPFSQYGICIQDCQRN